MEFNFDQLTERRQTNCYKWDGAPADVLPMWVADMDFRTAPVIIEALRQRVEHGIFGYTRVPRQYYEAVCRWFAHRHNWTVRREWILYTSGVVPAVSAILKALTLPGDRVVVQTPVYNCFFSSIRNSGCEIAAAPLRREGDTYRMDFEALEAQLSDERTRVMLLCNPHNPAGRMWTRAELTRMGELCLRHNVIVLADEIHGELAIGNHRYIPFASISEAFSSHSITCVSPSKAFNIAGLQIASIICPDPYLRLRVDRALNINEVCDVNPFGVLATIAAYNEGEEWLLALLKYIGQNYSTMREYCAEHLPDFPLMELEGTYLVWMDCRSLGMSSAELGARLKSEALLWLNDGSMYGADGDGYMRWNIACPRSRMLDGLERFRHWVEQVRK